MTEKDKGTDVSNDVPGSAILICYKTTFVM
jgi:hypothetical protein